MTLGETFKTDDQLYEFYPPGYTTCPDTECSYCYRRDDKILNKINRHCTGLWNDEIKNKIVKLASSNTEERILPIVAIPLATLAGAGVGYVYGNVVHYTDKLKGMFQEHEILFEDLLVLKNFTLSLKDVVSATISQTTKLNKKFLDLENEFIYLSNGIADYVWGSMKLYKSTLTLSERLEGLKRSKEEKRVDTKALSYIVNLPELRKVDPEFTLLEETSHQEFEDGIELNLRFILARKSNSTHVYKLSSFDIWELSETPRLKRYVGPKVMLYNVTSNCKKAVYETDKMIIANCSAQDYEEKTSNKWETIDEVNSFEETTKLSPQYKANMLFHYVYCFPHNITIRTSNIKCPPHAFRLPNTIKWSTFDKDTVPSFVSLNQTVEFNELIFDSVFWQNFAEPTLSNDLWKWINESSFYRKELERYKVENLFVPKEVGRDFLFSIFSFLFLLILIIILFKKRKKILECFSEVFSSKIVQQPQETLPSSPQNTDLEMTQPPVYPSMNHMEHLSKLDGR